MKSFLKLLIGALVGITFGFLLVGLVMVVTGHITWAGYWAKLWQSADAGFALAIVLALVWTLLSLAINLIAHEGGHLLAGLLTGYRFVSFRIGSFTLIRQDGHYVWKKFQLAGTGGQCLMSPPNKPIDDIDTRLYNAGGALVNLLLALAAGIPLLCMGTKGWVGGGLLMFFLIALVMALGNGIPMKMSGIANDGYNLLHLEHNRLNKQCFVKLLRINALTQCGTPIEQLPDDLFTFEAPLSWKESIQASALLLVVNRLEASHDFEQAHDLLCDAQAQSEHMLPLLATEVELELAFVCLVTGRNDEARRLLTEKNVKYMNQYRRTQSDKQRQAFAVALLLDGDRTGAQTLLQELLDNREKYVQQGQVATDVALAQHLLAYSTLGSSI